MLCSFHGNLSSGWCVMSVGPASGDVNFGHLLKMVSVVSSLKEILSPFSYLMNVLWGGTLTLCKIHSSLYIHPPAVASPDDSCN